MALKKNGPGCCGCGGPYVIDPPLSTCRPCGYSWADLMGLSFTGTITFLQDACLGAGSASATITLAPAHYVQFFPLTGSYRTIPRWLSATTPMPTPTNWCYTPADVSGRCNVVDGTGSDVCSFEAEIGCGLNHMVVHLHSAGGGSPGQIGSNSNSISCGPPLALFFDDGADVALGFSATLTIA